MDIRKLTGDLKVLFDDVCDERKECYVRAARMFAANGCFDDAQFLLALIGDTRSVPGLIGIQVLEIDF